MNGWTNTNQVIREAILHNLNFDIVCISETHLRQTNKISLDEYTWYGHNRPKIPSAVLKGSSRVGVFVKNELFPSYHIHVIDKLIDGIMCLQFTDIISNFTFLVISTYLPPDGSPYANTDNFYSHLISIMYLYSHINCIIICGDLNSRIGTEKDFIKDIDTVMERHVLDNVKNSYCENFIDFLKDSKMCILNGRVTPALDNFTCINACGKSVVDYMLIHQENLNLVSKCEVMLVNELQC